MKSLKGTGEELFPRPETGLNGNPLSAPNRDVPEPAIL